MDDCRAKYSEHRKEVQENSHNGTMHDVIHDHNGYALQIVE